MFRIFQNPVAPLCSFILTVICFSAVDAFLGGPLDAWHPRAKYWMLGPAALCVIAGLHRYVQSKRAFDSLIDEAAEGRFYGASTHESSELAAQAAACGSTALCMGFTSLLVGISSIFGAPTPLGLAAASSTAVFVSLLALITLSLDRQEPLEGATV